jgi:hypothetical protein
MFHLSTVFTDRGIDWVIVGFVVDYMVGVGLLRGGYEG